MKFAWIADHQAAFDVACMCQVLEVSRGGFYAWKKRPACARQERKHTLIEEIRRAHARSHGIYGSPRVAAELAERGIAACVNTVAKYMQEAGISSKIKRRFRARTTDSGHGLPVAENLLLGRAFSASGPDQKWCCDITYIPTGEGFLYVAAVLDIFSRRIVGWSMAEHLRAELCLDGLAMAITRRKPEAGLIHHSDRGVQYACSDYRRVLEDHGIIASMSRTGDCYDNAMMESFWGTLKTEWTHHQNYATREQAKASVFYFMEVFYNRQRRHSAIGYKSPEAFEASLN